MDHHENPEAADAQDVSPSRDQPGVVQAAEPGGKVRLGERPLIAHVFLNERELRSGWRVLIFFVVWLVLLVLMLALTRGSLSAEGGARALFAGETIALISVVAAAGIMSVAEKRSFAHYGLPWRLAFHSEFWWGVLWGAVALTALLGLIHFYHGFQFGPLEALRSRKLLLGGGAYAVGFLVVGLAEEYLFRGYPLYTLSGGMGFWPAAILLSVAFGAVHLKNPGEDWAGALGAALIGLFFCFTVRRTGNLWFAIGLHSMWDYSESFIFAVPDSGTRLGRHLFDSALHGPAWLTGGRVGPEASVFVFVVIANLFIVFHLLHPKARFQTAASDGN